MLTDRMAQQATTVPVPRGAGVGVAEVLQSKETPVWCDAAYLAVRTGMVTSASTASEVDAAVEALVSFFVRKFSLCPTPRGGKLGWSRDELLARCLAETA